MAVERFNRSTVNVGTTETVVLNAYELGDTIVITGRASTTSGTEQSVTLYINSVPVQTTVVPADDTATLDGDKLVLKAGDVLTAVSSGNVDLYMAALEREGGAGSSDAAGVAAQTAVEARDVATTKAAQASASATAAYNSSQSAAESASTALTYATGGLVRVAEDDTGLDYLGTKIEAEGVLSVTTADYSGNQKVKLTADLSDYATNASVTSVRTEVLDAAVLVQTEAANDLAGVRTELLGEVATVDGRVDTVVATASSDKAELAADIAAVDAKIAPAVTAGIESVIGTAPAALDTLSEIAAAINDDANYAATITSQLATKVENSVYTAGLATKADASAVYTTTETDSAISTAVTTAVNSAVATERTTTQGQVDTLQSSINTLNTNVTNLQNQVNSLLDSLGSLQTQINSQATTHTNDISGLQTQIDAKAPLANPAFTGTVTCTGDIIAYYA